MPDFKNMIEGMKEQETPEAPTQEETEKAGKLADSGFKIGEHRFIGKDNNKANPGFIAYGGNNPDQKLSTKELAKIYDEQQKAKSVSPEQDRLAKLKKDAIAESQATAKKEAPLVDKPKVDRFEELSKTWKDKPHKVFNGKEYYIRPYTDFAGNRFYDINAKKQDEDFDLGSASGYDFKTEDEARKTIDEWENNANQNLLMGLTPEQRQAHYEKIFKENDSNDEIFGGKGRAYGDLADLYNGYDIPKGQPFDENLTDEHNKKMLEEFDDYVQQRGWYPEKGKEKYPDKARRGEEDIMAEYRDIKQDDIPEAIRQLEEKKKTAKNDDEWERYDEQARLLRRDWEENYGREPEPRLLKPTDDFTDAEIKNFLDYLFYTNIDQGYTYEKTPQGDYYTNLVAGDPEAEPVVVNEEQLKGFLRNSLQSVDNLAQNLYEWQIDNQ